MEVCMCDQGVIRSPEEPAWGTSAPLLKLIMYEQTSNTPLPHWDTRCKQWSKINFDQWWLMTDYNDDGCLWCDGQDMFVKGWFNNEFSSISPLFHAESPHLSFYYQCFWWGNRSLIITVNACCIYRPIVILKPEYQKSRSDKSDLNTIRLQFDILTNQSSNTLVL